MKILWEKVKLDEVEGVVMQTPFGYINAENPLSPQKQFDIEILHTDFVILNRHIVILNTTLGVDAIYPVSPYKCIVCFSKLINKEKTKQVLEIRICGHITNSYSDFEDLPEDIQKKCKSDVNLIFPNGEVDGFNNNDNEYDDKLKLYNSTAELVGGIVHKSN